MTQTDQPERTLQRATRLYDAQTVLFAPRVSRLALSQLQLPTAGDRRLRVNVWRNHAIESLLPLLAPYCTYGGWQPDFRLSGYDDTLIFADLQKADVELLWLDSGRFLAHTSFADWVQWLETRLQALRAATVAPIILATWCEGGEERAAVQALADAE